MQLAYHEVAKELLVEKSGPGITEVGTVGKRSPQNVNKNKPVF